MWTLLTLGALLAALLALGAALHMRRRWRSALLRGGVALVCGVACGVLAFSVLTRIPAELDWLFAYNYPRLADDPDADYDETLVTHKGAVVDELWARALRPEGQRAACYSDDATVCALADRAATLAAEEYGLNRGASFYGLRAWLGVGFGLAGALALWYLARPRSDADAPPDADTG